MKSPFLFFLKLYFKVSLTPIENSIRNELFNKHSFRIPENLNGSWRTLPQFLRRAVSLVLTRANSKCLVSKIIVLDTSPNAETERRDYLNIVDDSSVYLIFRKELPNDFVFFGKLSLLIKLLILTVVLLPRFIFKKNREKTAHVLLELVECELILKRLKNFRCEKLFVFGAFEKDASFQQLMFKLNKISATIIPSSNPISLYYKTVIASSFAFTAPYQAIEFEKLKNMWEVDVFLRWPPFDYPRIPLNKSTRRAAYDLGFMSSGMYLREQLGFATVGDGQLNRAEQMLILMLKQALEKKLIKNFIIYLHPLEKRSKENLQLSSDYYKNVFGENVMFGAFDKSSRDTFSEVEIAISGFSSVLMERLYGGHKVIFAPMGELQNFYYDSRIDQLSVNSLPEFIALYSTVLQQTNKEYFETFCLQSYLSHFRNIPNVYISK